ncbi:MAG: hypothetical protein HY701_03760 [Gemmatimonadetes bacterium]|nr:hypothetical protein [Gemmatimonadota bacterium]
MCSLVLAVLLVVSMSTVGMAAEPAADRLVPDILVLGPSPAWVTPQNEAMLALVAEMGKVGLKTTYEALPNWPAFVRRASSKPWKWGIAAGSFAGRPARLDPHEFLTTGLTQAYAGEGGTNFGGYANPKFQELAARQAEIMEPKARKALVFEAQKLVADDLYFQYQYNGRSLIGYNQQAWDNAVMTAGGNAFASITNMVSIIPKGADRTIKVGEIYRPRPLNPFNIPSAHEYFNLRLVYDTLAELSPAGVPEPWLARSWKMVDDTTIDVELREAHWHDGKPVTAEDVAFTFQMYQKHPPGYIKPGVDPVRSVVVTGPRSARFKLAKPFAPFIHFSFSGVLIVPRHVWDGVVEREKVKQPDEWATPNLTGSGPFKVVKVVPGEGYVYTANKTHYLKPPRADGLVYKGFANSEARFLALASGQIDFHTIAFYTLTADQAKEAKASPALKVVEARDIGGAWVTFNLREGSPFQDYALRRAVSHLIDRKKIVEDFALGLAEPGCSVIAPANAQWHNPAVRCPEHDPGKARQVLVDAGYQWDGKGRLYFPVNHKPTLYPSLKR